MMTEMTRFNRQQRADLQHFIINVLTDTSISKLLKQVKSAEDENITITRKDAKAILDNLEKIRKFIIDLPKEVTTTD